MKFEQKISGVSITEFDIEPIFNNNYITLEGCLEKVHKQKSMDWLLDNIRFTLGTDGRWHATLDWDSILKLSIAEKYPGYEKEIIENVGENWLNRYLRFNH